jgi:DNA-binding CsgD family transcriptional regulator
MGELMLLGREAECRRIDALLARARAGSSGVLVIRGEPGIGKTALLDHAAATAGRARVLRASGVESEVEIAFAGLHELLRPVLDAIDRLPDPQAAALRSAFGLTADGSTTGPLAGAATLALLGALAEDGPVLVLLDDAQWLDGPSAAALMFAARRLLADAVTVIVSLRADAAGADALALASFEGLLLSGLADGPARALLEAHCGRPVPAATASWLQAETGGNPLALVELAADAPRLRPGPVGDHVPVSARIEHAFGRRLDGLPAAALTALVVTAVADAADIAPVLSAAAALGGTLAGLEAAEAAGLVVLDAGRVAFRHPLVRSVVLGRVAPSDRRAAHRAYAAAVAASDDRRAWHAAAGAVAPDEAIASALAETGARAAHRGGHAAAAHALEQAARLTPEPEQRAVRLRRAAEAAWLAGDGQRALAALDEAAPLPVGTALRADAEHLRGRVLARRGPVPLAIRVLREGAEAVAADAPGRAAEMFAEAAFATVYGDLGEEMDRLAQRAAALAPPGDARARCLATTALGAALVLRGQPDATAVLRQAARLAEATPELREDVRLAAWIGVAPAFMRADAEAYAPLERAIGLARERGAVGVLPFALFYRGVAELSGPRWTEAAATFAESIRLAEETGLAVDAVASLAGLARLEARRGTGAEHAATVLLRARAAGMPFFEVWALHAQGELALGGDDADAAVAAFEAKQRVLDEHRMEDADLSPAPELAEARLRLGDEPGARAAAAAALAGAQAKRRPWALARATRAEALTTADDGTALAAFAAALELHALASDTFEAARTRLCLGERLRRTGRRAGARPELRAALEDFERLGAAPWADRAGAELRATGETVRRRDPSSLDELTPQELRIALMLAGGATTRQAAGTLYLSPKTVEYHLRHVYLKLGVNSRAALAAAVRGGQSSSAISSAARAAPLSRTGV